MRSRLERACPELTFNEMRVLMHTGRHPDTTQKDLIEQSHTDKAQMARVLASLEGHGWLQRTSSETDKRVRCIHLSAQGRQLYTRLRELQHQVAGELLKDLPSAAQKEVLALLQAACDSANGTNDR